MELGSSAHIMFLCTYAHLSNTTACYYLRLLHNGCSGNTSGSVAEGQSWNEELSDTMFILRVIWHSFLQLPGNVHSYLIQCSFLELSDTMSILRVIRYNVHSSKTILSLIAKCIDHHNISILGQSLALLHPMTPPHLTMLSTPSVLGYISTTSFGCD